MPFVAAAERLVTASADLCFARLVDFPSWTRWMPASFRPAAGPTRALAVGDVMRIRIAGLPLPAQLRVLRCVAGRELAWRGGVPGVLMAEHVFYFEPAGAGATRVRSEETWSGALARVRLLARRVRAMAERVGREQLDALARSLAS
jgi:hypothetical protein